MAKWALRKTHIRKDGRSCNDNATGDRREAVASAQAPPADAEVCGRICYAAFSEISSRHNFPPDFPAPEVAIRRLAGMFSHPGIYTVVAESQGKIVGSNCMDERSPIAGIGPITIDPGARNKGVGQALMRAALDRATERKFAGVRLVQAAFHNRSLSLYTKLGFVTREPLSCMQGQPIRKPVEGYNVRAAQAGDLEACNALCVRVHGYDRGGELSDAIAQGTAVVAECRGRVRTVRRPLCIPAGFAPA